MWCQLLGMPIVTLFAHAATFFARLDNCLSPAPLLTCDNHEHGAPSVSFIVQVSDA
jgi:hypothetical protein